jgi:DNA-binding CsgD family transcriptional regulator
MHEGARLLSFASAEESPEPIARAEAIAARLELHRAEAAVWALAAIGVAGAVLSAAGLVVAANAPLEALRPVLTALRGARLALASAAANAALQAAIAGANQGSIPRSMAVPAIDGRPPLVIHLLPLRQAALGVFDGAELLVAVTPVRAAAPVPPPSVFAGLFGLTPAEARLAAALSQGRPLREAASDVNITVKSARTYLERIFAKTGTHQQSELVALLKSVESIP